MVVGAGIEVIEVMEVVEEEEAMRIDLAAASIGRGTEEMRGDDLMWCI